MRETRFLVAYYSLTGNTRRVAEAVYSVLPGKKRLMDIGEEIPAGPFDLIFLGFPVMQFGVPRPVQKFVRVLPGRTRTALFITHAMFEDPGQQVMLTRELEKCRSIVPEENLAGFFHCRGELSPAMAKELRATGLPMLQGFADLQPFTAGHPDQEELEAARQWARKVGDPDGVGDPVRADDPVGMGQFTNCFA